MTQVVNSLYEQDILLWVEETVAKLRAHDFENLDLDNLIEEVESLGISQKKDCRKQACGRWVLLHLSDEFEEVGFVEGQSGVFGIK